jgi:hypothetical protein
MKRQRPRTNSSNRPAAATGVTQWKSASMTTSAVLLFPDRSGAIGQFEVAAGGVEK